MSHRHCSKILFLLLVLLIEIVHAKSHNDAWPISRSHPIVVLESTKAPFIPRGGSTPSSSPSPSSSSSQITTISPSSPRIPSTTTSPLSPSATATKSTTKSTTRRKRSRGVLKGTIFETDSTQVSATTSINQFLTRDSRRNFITKVYTILTCQLLTTSLFVTIFQYNKPVILSILSSQLGPFVHLSLCVASFVSMYTLMADPSRRRGKNKYKYLSVFTIFESLLVGTFTTFFPTRMVISAAMTTAVGVGGVTLATVANKNPKYDLTQMGQGITSLTSVFVGYVMLHILGRIMGFSFNLPWNELLFCGFGAGLASAWLGYHTSLIVGGKHNKYKMHEDDYVFGAVAVYNDVINLFIYILRILSETQRRRE